MLRTIDNRTITAQHYRQHYSAILWYSTTVNTTQQYSSIAPHYNITE